MVARRDITMKMKKGSTETAPIDPKILSSH